MFVRERKFVNVPIILTTSAKNVKPCSSPIKRLTDKQKLIQALENGDSETALAILSKPKRVRIRDVDGNAKTVKQYVNAMRKKVADPCDLRELVMVADYVNGVVAEVVVELKKGYSWEAIGEGVNMTRTGCWEKFGGYCSKRSALNKTRRDEGRSERVSSDE